MFDKNRESSDDDDTDDENYIPQILRVKRRRRKKERIDHKNFVSHLLFAGHERLAVQLLVSSRRKVTSFESVSERGHVDLCVREKMSFFYDA